MGKFLATAGVALIVVATSAASAPAGKSATKPSGETSEAKYCVTFEGSTGSRVARTECRTKAEWKRLGIDVDAPADR